MSAFSFGKNWQSFLQHYSPERQDIARKWLLDFLEVHSLAGKTFLDIGSGSGIHSASACLSGAARIHSFDYDENSVEATKHLFKHMGSPLNWTVDHASVLDQEYINRLDKFDIVYSWGVLHHTGSQWKAIENAASCMRADGMLYIALYSKEAYPDWEKWCEIKQRYNEAHLLTRYLMEAEYIWTTTCLRDWRKLVRLPAYACSYRKQRGMALLTDIRDWLGGWPTEFSSVQEVCSFLEQRFALKLVNLRFGEGNSEFLFMSEAAAQAQGRRPWEPEDMFYNLPELSSNMPFQHGEKVWIFGAAEGAKLVYKFLNGQKINVCGFIDIMPACASLYGLPVVSFDDFVKQQPKDIPVILASKYVSANWIKLKGAGFHRVVNAFTWIRKEMVRSS